MTDDGIAQSRDFFSKIVSQKKMTEYLIILQIGKRRSERKNLRIIVFVKKDLVNHKVALTEVSRKLRRVANLTIISARQIGTPRIHHEGEIIQKLGLEQAHDIAILEILFCLTI